MTAEGKGGTILLVDDVPDNLRLLSRMLGSSGYAIHAAKTGVEAIASVHAEKPDLVLLDINLPDMSGYDVCKALKADALTQGIPVVFISALSDTSDKLRGFALGGVDFISKPFTVEEVLVRVQTQLRISGLHAELERKSAELELKNGLLLLEINERKRLGEQASKTLANLENSKAAALNLLEDLKSENDLRKAAETQIQSLNANLEESIAHRTAQLQASNTELEAFAYSVAHDLRSPLRAIDGFSRILQDEYSKNLDGEGLRLLGVIRSSAQNMEILIRDLLDITKVGKTDIVHAAINMEAMARESFLSCADAATAIAIEFKCETLPQAHADRRMMARVWVNLLSNAIKYSPQGKKGKIEVSGFAREGINVYAVRDHGIGFDQRYAGKLFGMFQRLHSARELEGSGIGLAIVKRVVERHGGTVWAEGVVGQGAVFYFSLPARSAS